MSSALPNLGTMTGAYAPAENGWTASTNQNWQTIDDLAQLAVVDMTLTSPPGSPSDGDRYIVPTGATGSWSGHANAIARYVGSSSTWMFYTPRAGWIAYSVAQAGTYQYNGATWGSMGGGGGGSTPLPVNPQTGTSYTLALTDAPSSSANQGIVTMNNASANAVAVPPHSSVAFPVGTQVQVSQLGAGQTSISAGSGVTVNTPSTAVARVQYSTLVLTQVATDVWVLGGDMQ